MGLFSRGAAEYAEKDGDRHVSPDAKSRRNAVSHFRGFFGVFRALCGNPLFGVKRGIEVEISRTDVSGEYSGPKIPGVFEPGGRVAAARGYGKSLVYDVHADFVNFRRIWTGLHFYAAHSFVGPKLTQALERDITS